MTLWAGLKTQLFLSLDKNVIWTNKLWAAVYFKRNIKGPKNSQLNFPTKSCRRFLFQYCCKLWFPRERQQHAASSCHSLLKRGSLVRLCHDPMLQASVSTHIQLHSVCYTVWTCSLQHFYFGPLSKVNIASYTIWGTKSTVLQIFLPNNFGFSLQIFKWAVLCVCVFFWLFYINRQEKQDFLFLSLRSGRFSRCDEFWMTSVSAEVNIPNS